MQQYQQGQAGYNQGAYPSGVNSQYQQGAYGQNLQNQNLPGPGQPGYNPDQYLQQSLSNSSQSIYDIYNQMYYGGAGASTSGLLSPLGISPKLPLDEVLLIILKLHMI